MRGFSDRNLRDMKRFFLAYSDASIWRQAGAELSDSAIWRQPVAKLAGGAGARRLPRAALLQTAEGNFVYTVSGERFVRAAVKVGVLNDEFVEITDGLYAGDQVAAQPVMTLWLAELQSLRGGKACADGH